MTGYFKVTALEGKDIGQALDELTDYAVSHPDARLTVSQDNGQIEDRNRREDGSDIPVSERKGEEDDEDDIFGINVTAIDEKDEDTEETRKKMAEHGWTKESTDGNPPDWVYHNPGPAIRMTKIAEADADDAGPAAPKTDSKKKNRKHRRGMRTMSKKSNASTDRTQMEVTAAIMKHLIIDSETAACQTFGITDANKRKQKNGKIDMKFQDEIAEEFFQRALRFIELVDEDKDKKENKEE